jgi:acetyl esterase/lipase
MHMKKASILRKTPVKWVVFLASALLLSTAQYLHSQESINVDRGIVFCTHDGIDLKLDIAYPKQLSGLHPALLFISGSGWGYWWGASFDRNQYSYTIVRAAQRGYVAATVDYRPTSILDGGKPKCRYPDQLIDIRSAVRWLRANAQKYQIDSDRIGAVGWSSGGHLALMLALLGTEAIETETDNVRFSPGVQAVASLAGPTELALMHDEATFPGIPKAIEELMGGPPDQMPEKYREASPLYHVSSTAPPILMIQGEMDTEVPRNQASLFAEQMKKIGSSVTVQYLSNTGHMINSYAETEIYPFLDQALKNDQR